MFYDKFIKLCNKKGVTPAQVRKDLGISQSTMASWKSRGLTPNATTLAKLADYFGVSVDYLFAETWGIVAGGKIKAGGGIKSIYGVKAGGGIEADGPIEIGPGVYIHQVRVNAAMEQMSEEGRKKVADYAEDILPNYRRQAPPRIPPGAADLPTSESHAAAAPTPSDAPTEASEDE